MAQPSSSVASKRCKSVGYGNSRLNKIMKLHGKARQVALAKFAEEQAHASTSGAHAGRVAASQSEAQSLDDARLAANHVHVIRLFGADEIATLASLDEVRRRSDPNSQPDEIIRDYPGSDARNPRNRLLRRRKMRKLDSESKVDATTMERLQPLMRYAPRLRIERPCQCIPTHGVLCLHIAGSWALRVRPAC